MKYDNKLELIKEIKSNAYYLSEHIKDSKLKIIKNTGHIVNEENPKELSMLINKFWQ